MKTTSALKIKAPRQAVAFFDKLLKNKAENKLEVKRKYKNGSLKTSN